MHKLNIFQSCLQCPSLDTDNKDIHELKLQQQSSSQLLKDNNSHTPQNHSLFQGRSFLLSKKGCIYVSVIWAGHPFKVKSNTLNKFESSLDSRLLSLNADKILLQKSPLLLNRPAVATEIGNRSSHAVQKTCTKYHTDMQPRLMASVTFFLLLREGFLS